MHDYFSECLCPPQSLSSSLDDGLPSSPLILRRLSKAANSESRRLGGCFGKDGTIFIKNGHNDDAEDDLFKVQRQMRTSDRGARQSFPPNSTVYYEVELVSFDKLSRVILMELMICYL
ncbi:hypothetical protein Leryth_010006 [Lithospermum erythrorhizon]|nr:hypothetical protein Leryth_010006 [Lithospermum erythrorhizon]